MKRNVCIICTLLLSLVLHYGCSEESSHIKDSNNGFQLSMDGGVTRSSENEAILDNMRLYCFSQGGTPLAGNGGSWDSQFDNQILGVKRTGMTLNANAVKTGDWDLVMVSAKDVTLTPPISVKKSSEALMYTYDPGAVQADGSRNKAHEIWYRMLRIPTVTSGNKTTASCGISRNASMVRVVVDRAVDIDMSAGAEHRFELHDVPDKISWSGTLLRTTGPGTYETSKTNPDVLPQPLTGKFTFEDNSSVETGTYKSNILNFIIPAHRETDFWTDNTNPKSIVQDTLVHRMSVFVSFAKASGGRFEKTAEINRATRCNGILEVHLKMKDVNLELSTTIVPWKEESVPGDFEAPYLNISDVETTVYDGAASRIYFWSNQPKDSVFILNKGVDGVTDVDAVFDRIAGKDAVNRYYDPATKSGYIDIANLKLAATPPDTKIYLKAGKLLREITVKRSVSAQALKKIKTPYIGTFHRGNQMGERLVTWDYIGPWTAYIDNDASASEVTIDRLPSPAFSDATLYGGSPSDAEIGIVSNDANSVTGMNTIYFRVGWKSMHSATDEPRYASITVRQGTNNPSGTVIQTLYVRQGEMASALYSAPRINPARFSPYNLTSASGSGPVSVGGGIPTEYPSQCGSYFQWMDHNNTNYAYPTSGTANPWNKNHPFYETYWTEGGANMSDIYETCPTGYRRVSDGATNAEVFTSTGTLIGTSELRQSLWLDPTATTATNTLSGYYADGFFDRQAIVNSPNNAVNTAAGSGVNIAYKGKLFYNNSTKGSLFFPAAGQRVVETGALDATGVKGYYWTSSSTLRTQEPTGTNAYISTRLRNTAVNIRCVVE